MFSIRWSTEYCTYNFYYTYTIYGNINKKSYLLGILGVVLKQLSLLRCRVVGDSTTVVDSMSPTMIELIQDAVASCRGDIIEHFELIKNEFYKFVDLKL